MISGTKHHGRHQEGPFIRSELVTVRLAEIEYERVAKAAAECGINPAAWIRTVVLQKLKLVKAV